MRMAYHLCTEETKEVQDMTPGGQRIHTFQLFIDGCPFRIADFQEDVYLQSKKAKNLQKMRKKRPTLKVSIQC